MDTKIGCLMKPEVVMQRRKFSREFKVEADLTWVLVVDGAAVF
jgi:hypothetical protein